MNKKELAVLVAQNAGISNASAARAVDAVLDGITKAVKRNEVVRLIGFGTFSTVRTKAREGRNPKTGDPIKIKAQVRPVFKAGVQLKEAVN